MELVETKQYTDSAYLRKIIAYAADGVFDSSGNIFRQLVNNITQALNVTHAYIGEICEDDPDSVRIIYGDFDGHVTENETINLEGSPCKNVINQVYRYYPKDVSKLFPMDKPALEMNIEGYAAIPLFDSKGRSQGLMVIMNTQPLTDPELTESLLKIFSVRASIELERLYTKEASIKTEEQYQTIFNKSLDGLLLIDLQGKIVDVNPACAQMHGYSRDELIKMRPDQFIPPESRQAFHDFVKAVAQNKPFHTVANGKRNDGSRYLADVRGVYMEYRGEPHLLAILRDVTDQVEHETELRNSKDRLRATIDVSMDGIIIIDAEGQIMEFNPAAEQTFGYKKQDVIGKSLADLIIPEQYRNGHNRALLARKKNKSLSMAKRREISAMRSDGTEFPVELTIDAARDKDGDIFIGYIRDITDRKQAEEERSRLEAQLRQSQKMQAIGHLAGGIAHDFNNILTGVLGYVVLAQEKAQQQCEDPKIINYLERAQKSGQKARDLIQQLLTFSRGQRGEPRPVSLDVLVSESVKLLSSTLPSSIEISTHFDNQLPKINVDPVHIEQIIMNLCINARDAMNNNGRLHIAVRNYIDQNQICCSCKKMVFGHFVELSVEDTGSGIPSEVLDRIFEPFYSTKEIGKGTGMGLSTVHGIVHEYNGHIIVDSEPGKGSVFRILIKPLIHSKTQNDIDVSADGPPILSSEKLTGHVLLVDDESIVSEFMEDLLDSWGLKVTVFNSSVDAYSYFEKNHAQVDLAILDQSMPKMTGLQLAEKIVDINPTFPIIMYTGYSEDISPEKISKLGVLALVKKPIDVPKLHALLESILGQKPS